MPRAAASGHINLTSGRGAHPHILGRRPGWSSSSMCNILLIMRFLPEKAQTELHGYNEWHWKKCSRKKWDHWASQFADCSSFARWEMKTETETHLNQYFVGHVCSCSCSGSCPARKMMCGSDGESPDSAQLSDFWPRRCPCVSGSLCLCVILTRWTDDHRKTPARWRLHANVPKYNTHAIIFALGRH